METNQNNQNANSIFSILKFTFVIVPIVAGLDKFTNILCDWTQYINPSILHMLPFSAGIFMGIIGIIEIVAGILVFMKPRIGGLVVSAWLTLIALTLLAGWDYVDVAVRDLVMAVSAFSMAKLAQIFDNK